MMRRYARIADGVVVELRRFAVVPDPNPKKGLDWRPCDHVPPPTAGEGEKVLGPIYTIGADKVVESWQVVAKTQQEQDDEASEATSVEMAAFEKQRRVHKLLFLIVNEVRALKGQQALSAAQFRSFVESL